MRKILCAIFGHCPKSHLDYIWGSLPREHIQCERCGKTLKFERPNPAREAYLLELDDIRDGDVRGCKPI